MFRKPLGSWLWAVLFVQALLFLRLVRYGQPIALSAIMAGIFAVTCHYLVLALHRGLNLRQWPRRQRQELLYGMGWAIGAALVLCVAARLWPQS